MAQIRPQPQNPPTSPLADTPMWAMAKHQYPIHHSIAQAIRHQLTQDRPDREYHPYLAAWINFPAFSIDYHRESHREPTLLGYIVCGHRLQLTVLQLINSNSGKIHYWDYADPNNYTQLLALIP